jgi:flagellar hook-associated protein 1
MGLSSSLQIGNSALTASSLALQVAGNNLANAATPGYSRQIAYLTPARTDSNGRISIGTGVRISDVRRQFDHALQARLNTGVSQEAAAGQQHRILAQIESALGELGDNDLSSQLSKFFGSWSERANLSQSSAVVVQQGQALSDFVRRLRSDLSDQREQIDRQLSVQVDLADGLLSQVADLNRAISDAEAGGGRANALRDQRDTVITELSQYMDLSAIEQPNGSVDILIGSTPVVLGGDSRGIELRRRTEGNSLSVSVNVKQDGQQLGIRSGQIGSMLADRDTQVRGIIGTIDRLTSQLIFEVNKLHSTGTNASGLSTTTGSLSIAAPDRTLALNDPSSGTFAGLPYQAVSGGFTIQVKAPGGATQSVRVDIDLDGRTAGGAAGFGDDTSPEDIRAALDAVPGISATIDGEGRLKVDADPGFSFSFSEDSSGALAVMGVNSFFTGTDGSDIGVRQALHDNPSLLTTGRIINGTFVENGTALAIADVQNQALSGLGGQTLKRSWTDSVQQLGVRTDAAGSASQAASVVRQSLEAQRASVSGVSIDEESINLMTFQRQYQGAARFISIVDEMTQTLIALI